MVVREGIVIKKYKNIGKPVAFLIDNKSYDFVHGEIKEVPDDFMDKLKDHITKLEDVTGPPMKKVLDEYSKIKMVPVEETEVKAEVPLSEPKEEKYSKAELEFMEFSELREIGNTLGVKFRSRAEGIKEILEAQK